MREIIDRDNHYVLSYTHSSRIMRVRMALTFDPIGYWSELKLDIVETYAREYSTILSKQSSLNHVYIDAFAGPGTHISKSSWEYVRGSPQRASRQCEMNLVETD